MTQDKSWLDDAKEFRGYDLKNPPKWVYEAASSSAWNRAGIVHVTVDSDAEDTTASEDAD
jgi:hypothetical protein